MPDGGNWAIISISTGTAASHSTKTSGGSELTGKELLHFMPDLVGRRGRPQKDLQLHHLLGREIQMPKRPHQTRTSTG